MEYGKILWLWVIEIEKVAISKNPWKNFMVLVEDVALDTILKNPWKNFMVETHPPYIPPPVTR